MTHELIKVNTNEEGKATVDARELHEFLGSGYNFANWIKRRIKEYDFVQDTDFIAIKNSLFSPPRKEYHITIDMAKELCMVERNEKGRQARKYFIECEKKLKELQTQKGAFKLPQTYVEALRQLADKVEENEKLLLENKAKNEVIGNQSDIIRKKSRKLKTQKLKVMGCKKKIRRDRPKVEYYDKVLDSSDCFTVTQIAKIVEMTAKQLNEILRQEGIQFKQSGQWMLHKKYMGKGLTQTRSYLLDSGKTSQSTVWTEKGKKFIIDIVEDL